MKSAIDRAKMEDAIESVWQNGGEDLSKTAACEAVREMGVNATDAEILRQIRKQIPLWF